MALFDSSKSTPYRSGFTWQSLDNPRPVPIEELTDSHLVNAIRHVEKHHKQPHPLQPRRGMRYGKTYLALVHMAGMRDLMIPGGGGCDLEALVGELAPSNDPDLERYLLQRALKLAAENRWTEKAMRLVLQADAEWFVKEDGLDKSLHTSKTVRDF